MEAMDTIKNYVNVTVKNVGLLPFAVIEEIVDVLRKAQTEGRKTFIFGNGGSASTASHMVCDLSKASGLKNVMALTDNVPLITAWANDHNYDRIFVGQLAMQSNPGDVVIGISGSGNSDNVVFAMAWAKEHRCKTIAMTGFDGGAVGMYSDIRLIVPGDNLPQIEDMHLVVGHILTECMKDRR